MASCRLPFVFVSVYLYLLFVYGDETIGIRSAETSDNNSQEEKELIEALQDVLEKLKSKRILPLDKKLGWVPSVRKSLVENCDAGEQCAVRKGARIGKLCNCPRGTTCNFYILKCL
ncbi:cocaine- and amphetamine-regulated transcript protein-like [Mantella aurantiaca]